MNRATRHHVTGTAAAVALAVSFALAPAPGRAQSQPPAKNLELVHRTITDLLGSAAIQRIDVQATSFDEAGTLIATIADTYLDATVGPLGDARTAGEYGTAVINGFNDHRITGRVRVLGPASVVVATPADARELGRLLATAAAALHRAASASQQRVLLRDSARNMFDKVVVDNESGVPLLQQYVTQIDALCTASPDRIAALLVHPMGD